MNTSGPDRRRFLIGAGSMAVPPFAHAQQQGPEVKAASPVAPEKEVIKSRNLVFVHGIFGWGPGELGPLSYWGEALRLFDPAFTVSEAKVGPVSSFHDRACELFAQIRGEATVDYGEEHSKAAGHARFANKPSSFPKAFRQKLVGGQPRGPDRSQRRSTHVLTIANAAGPRFLESRI